MDSIDQGLELLSCEHRYELKDLLLFVSDRICFNPEFGMHMWRLLAVANLPQFIALKSVLFTSLVDCDCCIFQFVPCVHSLDVLEEEVATLPALASEGEFEVLSIVLDCFDKDWSYGQDNQGTKGTDIVLHSNGKNERGRPQTCNKEMQVASVANVSIGVLRFLHRTSSEG